MSYKKKIYWAIMILLIILVCLVIMYHKTILFILLFSGCLEPFGYPIHSNDIVKSIDSPNEKYTAIAFIGNGGATTSFSPQVSILKKGKKLGNADGNVFIGYHSRFIDISWKDDATLIITYDCAEKDIFKQEKAKDGISIVYNLQK